MNVRTFNALVTLANAEAWNADDEKFTFCIDLLEISAHDGSADIYVNRLEDKFEELLNPQPEKGTAMSLRLPPTNFDGRFSLVDLCARNWVTLAEARASARRTIDGKSVVGATYLVVTATGSIELVAFGPRLGRTTLWDFGKLGERASA